MRAAAVRTFERRGALIFAVALCGCGKIEQNDRSGADAARAQAQARRQKAACASPVAYDRLKGILFDRAIALRRGDRAKLDTLADYSSARMEDPVVDGRDAALDITRCHGRFILEIPPGAERGLAGARRLQAELAYSAQAAADGSGLVYRVEGAEPIAARLAAFNLTAQAYRPPPAIDDQAAGEASASTADLRADQPASPSRAAPVEFPAAAPARPAPPVGRKSMPPVRRRDPEPELASRSPDSAPAPAISPDEAGAATVRAFYRALGAGDGAAASARVIPEKRGSRAFSPEAISRFYGGMPEPVRLTGIVPLAGGAYRVSYRYSTGRARCDGNAVVRLTSRDGRQLIRSINALGGC